MFAALHDLKITEVCYYTHKHVYIWFSKCSGLYLVYKVLGDNEIDNENFIFIAGTGDTSYG